MQVGSQRAGKVSWKGIGLVAGLVADIKSTGWRKGLFGFAGSK